jgi:exodeoxyribonuclease VII small subunit
MSYDEAIKRAEQIIAQLEQAEALGMDEYRRLASEATALLKHCQKEIEGLASSLSEQ